MTAEYVVSIESVDSAKTAILVELSSYNFKKNSINPGSYFTGSKVHSGCEPPPAISPFFFGYIKLFFSKVISPIRRPI